MIDERKPFSGNVIEARGIKKSFGKLQAVGGLDFSVSQKECFGLLGPNGAGKTTMVRMVYCFIKPSGGELCVLGHNVLEAPRLIKAGIGVCPQENNLDPDLDVWDNLRVFARYFDIPRKTAEKRSEELLHFMGLDQKKNSSVEELSGGMKRRLMMIRSLLNDPRLLILDEPTTGLDPQARHQIWETIIKIKAQGTSVLLTTHYMEEAQHLCDRLIIMDQGKLVKEGSPRQLVHQNIARNVVEVTGSDVSVTSVIESLKLPFERSATHCYVFTDNGMETYKALASRFGEECCLLRMSNLEDVFLKVTGRNLRE